MLHSRKTLFITLTLALGAGVARGEHEGSIQAVSRQSPAQTTGRWIVKEIPNVVSDFPGHWVAPNENTPYYVRTLMQAVPSGLGMFIGADRGFNNASLSKKLTHVLLTDHDPLVVLYNKINIWLLKVARDRKDYLYLRQKASLAEWRDRLKEAKLDDQIPEILSRIEAIYEKHREEAERHWREQPTMFANPFREPPEASPEFVARKGDALAKVWDWWERVVRKGSFDIDVPPPDHLIKPVDVTADYTQLLQKYGTPDALFKSDEWKKRVEYSQAHRADGYYKANYLYEPEQFDRIQSLAKQGKIESVFFELGNPEDVERVRETLRQSGLQLSVVDLSNTWELGNGNAGSEGQWQWHLVRRLAPVAHDDAVLIRTGSSGDLYWSYTGFRLKPLAKEKTPADLYRKVENGRMATTQQAATVQE